MTPRLGKLSNGQRVGQIGPVLPGEQVEDLDPSLVNFLQCSRVGQVGPVVSGGQVGDLELSG